MGVVAVGRNSIQHLLRRNGVNIRNIEPEAATGSISFSHVWAGASGEVLGSCLCADISVSAVHRSCIVVSQGPLRLLLSGNRAYAG